LFQILSPLTKSMIHKFHTIFNEGWSEWNLWWCRMRSMLLWLIRLSFNLLQINGLRAIIARSPISFSSWIICFLCSFSREYLRYQFISWSHIFFNVWREDWMRLKYNVVQRRNFSLAMNFLDYFINEDHINLFFKWISLAWLID